MSVSRLSLCAPDMITSELFLEILQSPPSLCGKQGGAPLHRHGLDTPTASLLTPSGICDNHKPYKSIISVCWTASRTWTCWRTDHLLCQQHGRNIQNRWLEEKLRVLKNKDGTTGEQRDCLITETDGTEWLTLTINQSQRPNKWGKWWGHHL